MGDQGYCEPCDTTKPDVKGVRIGTGGPGGPEYVRLCADCRQARADRLSALDELPDGVF